MPARSIILHLHPLDKYHWYILCTPLLYQSYAAIPAMQFVYIRQLTHSAVRFRSVKSQFALIAHFLDNLVRQLGNGDFFPRTDIDMTVTDILEPGVYRYP